MPALKIKKVILFITVVLILLVTFLLLRLKAGIDQETKVNESQDFVNEGDVFIEDSVLNSESISGVLVEVPFVDNNNFFVINLGVESSLKQRTTLLIKALLVNGPDGKESILIAKVPEDSDIQKENYSWELYSKDKAINFLKDWVGEDITVTLIINSEESIMRNSYEEFSKLEGCTESCKSKIKIIKVNIPETIDTFHNYQDTAREVSDHAIFAMVTKIRVKK